MCASVLNISVDDDLLIKKLLLTFIETFILHVYKANFKLYKELDKYFLYCLNVQIPFPVRNSSQPSSPFPLICSYALDFKEKILIDHEIHIYNHYTSK